MDLSAPCKRMGGMRREVKTQEQNSEREGKARGAAD